MVMISLFLAMSAAGIAFAMWEHGCNDASSGFSVVCSISAIIMVSSLIIPIDSGAITTFGVVEFMQLANVIIGLLCMHMIMIPTIFRISYLTAAWHMMPKRISLRIITAAVGFSSFAFVFEPW